MVEFRIVNGQLQYRQRGFQVDASGAFCGVTDFFGWRGIEEVDTPKSPEPCPPDNLKDDDFSRETLIAICEAAVTNVKQWANRDSPGAHEQLGLCWVLLKSGCEFHVHPPKEGSSGCHTDDRTIWLTVEWPSFDTFEYGGGHEQDDMFYLPTPKRLREAAGEDWY